MLKIPPAYKGATAWKLLPNDLKEFESKDIFKSWNNIRIYRFQWLLSFFLSMKIFTLIDFMKHWCHFRSFHLIGSLAWSPWDLNQSGSSIESTSPLPSTHLFNMACLHLFSCDSIIRFKLLSFQDYITMVVHVLYDKPDLTLSFKPHLTTCVVTLSTICSMINETTWYRSIYIRKQRNLYFCLLPSEWMSSETKSEFMTQDLCYVTKSLSLQFWWRQFFV